MAIIGFIGLGHMGYSMVVNLLRHGHQVKVYDIALEAVNRATDQGAEPASNPADATVNSDFVFTMLQTSEQVSKTCLGDKGFLNDKGIFANLLPSAIYIDCSSISIFTSRALHQEAQQLALTMLDAPVSGGVKGAEQGTLTFMVGGEQSVYSRVKPILAAMGQQVIYAGSGGSGQAAKICNNLILGTAMIGICEAFALAERLGLDPKVFFDISSHASGECWAMTHYCPVPNILPDAPASHGYQPGFTTQMMLKDLKLSQDAAQQANLYTPLAAQATAIYQQFVQEGHANLDFSAIIQFIQGKL